MQFSIALSTKATTIMNVMHVTPRQQRLEPLHRAPPVLSVCLTPAARGHVPRASVPPRSGKHSTSSSYDEPASTALDVAQQQRQRRRQEQQPQQHQHQQRPASSGWPRPQEDVCRAISLRLKRAIDVKEVLMVVRLHAERFNEVSQKKLAEPRARAQSTAACRVAPHSHHQHATCSIVAGQYSTRFRTAGQTFALARCSGHHCHARPRGRCAVALPGCCARAAPQRPAADHGADVVGMDGRRWCRVRAS